MRQLLIKFDDDPMRLISDFFHVDVYAYLLARQNLVVMQLHVLLVSQAFILHRRDTNSIVMFINGCVCFSCAFFVILTACYSVSVPLCQFVRSALK